VYIYLGDQTDTFVKQVQQNLKSLRKYKETIKELKSALVSLCALSLGTGISYDGF